LSSSSSLSPLTAAQLGVAAAAAGLGLLASAPLWAQKMAERRALLAKHLNEGYARVVDYVESMMIELEGEKEAAVRLIALEQARIEEERRLWEEDKVRMAAVQQFASNKVRLNIGARPLPARSHACVHALSVRVAR
jgi:soluble lytic murein transglycosylase-like protein